MSRVRLLSDTLASQVAAAVENIRAYEAERSAAEELRRLSSLRADFVSMVSHELRAPMASVIGCAQTLADYSENIEFLGHEEESKRLDSGPQLRGRTSASTLFRRCDPNNVVGSPSGTWPTCDGKPRRWATARRRCRSRC